jgi:HK97 family phage prohead protease
MTTRLKYAPAVLKRVPTDHRGIFQALVSTFSAVPDKQGDIIAKGAFTKTIADAYARRAKRGDAGLWPVMYMHIGWKNPAAVIGVVTAATETEAGLVVEGKLDIETSEAAQKTFEHMLTGRISEWSIGYNVYREHARSDGVQVLDEVDMIEVSACPVNMAANAETRTLALKDVSTTSTSTATSTDARVAFTWRPDPRAELAEYKRRIDALAPPAREESNPDRVDRFVAEVRAELRAGRAREAERHRLIERTNATSQGDAPRVGEDMTPIE